MASFRVPLERVIDDSYDIEIGRDLVDNLIQDLHDGLVKGSSRYAIITDTECKILYGDSLLTRLQQQGFDAQLFSFGAGETSKTRETKQQLEDLLLAAGYGRDTCILAVGGGVVSDLVGFLAGTYCRGVPYLTYSTTLLAAADASIGGKTSVDTPLATNMIGLFNQPQKVYIDLSAWKSLPVRQIYGGLAETVKHACLADFTFFEYLETHIDQVVMPDGTAILDEVVCEHIAYTNCRIKYEVVKEDEKEAGLRQVLNLGHTVGRALEPLFNYELPHGEAVAIGLAAQVRLGREMGFMTAAETRRVIALLRRCGLPTAIPDQISNAVLVEKMHTDKKARQNKIRFVFQDGIGKIKYHDGEGYSVPLSDAFLLEMLEKIRCAENN